MKGDQVSGGVLVYESRSVRGANQSPVAKFSNTMEDVRIERAVRTY